MIFYSPELNEFVLITLKNVAFDLPEPLISHNFRWRFGDPYAHDEMFQKYAWYWIGSL
jgi:hypothetical protein